MGEHERTREFEEKEQGGDEAKNEPKVKLAAMVGIEIFEQFVCPGYEERRLCFDYTLWNDSGAKCVVDFTHAPAKCQFATLLPFGLFHSRQCVWSFPFGA